MANVKVFSTPGCANCMLIKNFLKENNVIFEEVNVAANRQAAKELVEKTKQMSLPVTQVNDKFIIGNNKVELMQAINEG